MFRNGVIPIWNVLTMLNERMNDEMPTGCCKESELLTTPIGVNALFE